jgi:hypothetical protein
MVFSEFGAEDAPHSAPQIQNGILIIAGNKSHLQMPAAQQGAQHF